MLDVLIASVVIATSLWVYFDAKSLGIASGQRGGLLDMGPGGWAICTLLLWIVVFPVYLTKRHKLNAAAKVAPAIGGLGIAAASSAPPDATAAATPVSGGRATKRCPYCAEEIQAAAILCRYCQRNLPDTPGNVVSSSITTESANTLTPPSLTMHTEAPQAPRPLPGVAIAAVVLGIGAVVMPYFAAVFLVPAAFVCGVIAFNRGRKGLGATGVILAVLGLVSIIYVSQQISTIAKDPFAPNELLGTDNPPVVTLSEYQQIREGMTYSDVTRIIGVAGEEVSRSDMAGYSTVMYSWTNPGGANMNAMFQNGELVNKAQFGLR